MSDQKIHAVHGPIGNEWGTYSYVIGGKSSAVIDGKRETVEITRIEESEQNMGTYGIQWLKVFAGEHLIAEVNALNCLEIVYRS